MASEPRTKNFGRVAAPACSLGACLPALLRREQAGGAEGGQVARQLTGRRRVLRRRRICLWYDTPAARQYFGGRGRLRPADYAVPRKSALQMCANTAGIIILNRLILVPVSVPNDLTTSIYASFLRLLCTTTSG